MRLVGNFLKTMAFAVCIMSSLSVSAEELRIGYQKSSSSLILLKESKLLEHANPKLDIKWIEFAAGPSYIEALNSGSVDVGLVGDLPPIFAQISGMKITYVAVEEASPLTQAILVKSDNGINDIAQLKGKTVALQKGSGSHLFLIRALNKYGMQLSDVVPAFLPQADARIAFERGKVDAWVTWEPYYSSTVIAGGANVLATGEGFVDSPLFYISSKTYADEHPEVLSDFVKAVQESTSLAAGDNQKSVDIVSQAMGISHPVAQAFLEHRGRPVIRALNSHDILKQQATADELLKYKVIPRSVNVSEAGWVVSKSE